MSVRNKQGRYAKSQVHRTVPILAAIFVATCIAYAFHANGIHAIETINEPKAHYGNEYTIILESPTSTFRLDQPDQKRNFDNLKEASNVNQTCIRTGNLTECFDQIKTRDFFRDQERGGAGDTKQVTRTISAFITQYSRADSCHNVVDGKCLMASTKPVYEGAVACPRNIPLGTKVRINGQIYMCEDRYSLNLDAKRGKPTFDIFVEQNPRGLYETNVEIL